MNQRLYLLLLSAILILAGCATATPAPDPDAGILNTGALPKALATVAPSATPVVQITPTDDGSRPQPTSLPPTITPTPTPLLGVFMGVQTVAAVEGTFAWIPTRGPKIVIATLRPGSRTPPPMYAGVPPGAFNPNGNPVVVNPVNVQPGTPGVVRNCGVPPAPQFAGAFARYGTIGDRLGCPVKPAFGLTLVAQPFQNGAMVWRETKEMFALSSTNAYFRVNDTWNDSIPANDPALVPPAGLQQPVRGFGFAWRSNGNIKNALGWALSGEQQFGGTWQDFERGFMITGLNGTVYALIPASNDGGQYLGAMTN